ncbi:hypothetical protein CYMTET_37782 [Cymbomonas tetramitiformis]|uniref:Uncharacterized protein n=1 Tax=Cymbomonas tetramitiformis TaxID=36881 RepID=A0AAE0CFK4_9CHLO|nr:hypothetical protein CYMTET_37783 [Cymbomonas tetramitiformis]KAK3252944.1 hypothetical protein CYMTET_37782 [Cymbomonas tetramitiformis]
MDFISILGASHRIGPWKFDDDGSELEDEGQHVFSDSPSPELPCTPRPATPQDLLNDSPQEVDEACNMVSYLSGLASTDEDAAEVSPLKQEDHAGDMVSSLTNLLEAEEAVSQVLRDQLDLFQEKEKARHELQEYKEKLLPSLKPATLLPSEVSKPDTVVRSEEETRSTLERKIKGLRSKIKLSARTGNLDVNTVAEIEPLPVFAEENLNVAQEPGMREKEGSQKQRKHPSAQTATCVHTRDMSPQHAGASTSGGSEVAPQPEVTPRGGQHKEGRSTEQRLLSTLEAALKREEELHQVATHREAAQLQRKELQEQVKQQRRHRAEMSSRGSSQASCEPRQEHSKGAKRRPLAEVTNHNARQGTEWNKKSAFKLSSPGKAKCATGTKAQTECVPDQAPTETGIQNQEEEYEDRGTGKSPVLEERQEQGEVQSTGDGEARLHPSLLEMQAALISTRKEAQQREAALEASLCEMQKVLGVSQEEARRREAELQAALEQVMVKLASGSDAAAQPDVAQGGSSDDAGELAEKLLVAAKGARKSRDQEVGAGTDHDEWRRYINSEEFRVRSNEVFDALCLDGAMEVSDTGKGGPSLGVSGITRAMDDLRQSLHERFKQSKVRPKSGRMPCELDEGQELQLDRRDFQQLARIYFSQPDEAVWIKAAKGTLRGVVASLICKGVARPVGALLLSGLVNGCKRIAGS